MARGRARDICCPSIEIDSVVMAICAVSPVPSRIVAAVKTKFAFVSRAFICPCWLATFSRVKSRDISRLGNSVVALFCRYLLEEVLGMRITLTIGYDLMGSVAHAAVM